MGCLNIRVFMNHDSVMSLVNHIILAVKDNTLTDILIIFHDNGRTYAIRDGDEQILVDVIITLDNYSYSHEIAKVVLEHIKILIFTTDLLKNKYPDTLPVKETRKELIPGYVDECMAKYYNCRVTKLHIYDSDKNFMRFWLPKNYSFLEESYRQ